MRRRSSWRRRGVVAVLLVGMVIGVVLGLQRWMVFPRHATVPDARAGEGVQGLERLSLPLEGQEPVEAWFLPGQGVGADAPGALAIFAHGNAELIEHWPDMLEHYRKRGVSVLLVEYRGYGRSGGTPSERGIVEDYVRAYDLVTARADVDASRVILHGRSIGGGVVCALARQRRPATIVLQSTFTSIVDMAPRWVPRQLVLDPFDNLAAVREIEAPILLVHGRRDSLIPLEHAETLADAARKAELVVYDADHNDCPPRWDIFWRDVDAFLERHGVLRPASSPTP